VNGTEVAVRWPENHVGEMAAIDPAARRSANVRALEPTVTAVTTEPHLTAVASRHPKVWRYLALELGNRLRERGRLVREPNSRPQLFIGSSREMLPTSVALRHAFQDDDIFAQVWTEGVFRASRDSVDSLLAAAERADFAALVMGPDDVVVMRGEELNSPRDNVVFELGLFMGILGRDRTYVVHEHGMDIHLPSDLLGFTPITFPPGPASDIDMRIENAWKELRRLIDELGVR
jgi:CRP/FNR family cyclic AMP-dependent transcriptional regulator